MATVANFALVHNPNIILPAGGEDFTSERFGVPGLAGKAVLLFRYRATEGRPTLKIRVNNNPERVSMKLVATDQSCSFHETILSNELTELNNEIKAIVTGTGTVAISDIMVLYQMTV